MEWLAKLASKYPTPENPNNSFTDADISAFENALGTSLPEDYYAFLREYGDGTFSSYIYINYPFGDNGSEVFMDEQQQRRGGNADLLEFMRCENIDSFTRSKIIAFGNHYPYPFYPDEGGLIFIGWTDDSEFFLRKTGDKFTVVMYVDNYYEFDMSFTEFLYCYMTSTIKLPMMWDEEQDWEFEPYYDDDTYLEGIYLVTESPQCGAVALVSVKVQTVGEGYVSPGVNILSVVLLQSPSYG